MPINREIGEVIEGMDDIFVVQPIEPWAEQSRLTTVVEAETGKKFKRKVEVEKPIWQAAVDHAACAFINAGASGPLRYDAVAQLYPRTGVITFVFSAIINGEERFVTAPFKLSDQQIADLTLRGLWQPYRSN